MINRGAARRLWDDPWPIFRCLLTLCVVVGSGTLTAIVLLMGDHRSVVSVVSLVIGLGTAAMVGVIFGFLLGAVVVAAAIVAMGAIVAVCVRVGWEGDGDAVRILALVALGLLVLAVVAISREFSRRTLRLAAVLALLAAAALTLKVGRINGGSDAWASARHAATTLDLRLQDVAIGPGAPSAEALASAQAKVDDLCRAAAGSWSTVFAREASASPASTAALCDVGGRPSSRRSDLLRVQAIATYAVDALGAGPINVGSTTSQLVDARTFGDVVTDGLTGFVQTVPALGDADLTGPAAIAAWVALGVCLLLGYRQLEILSGSGDIGPVDVRLADKKASNDDRRRLAQLRTFILRNVSEPGAVPGSSTLKPVGDLLAATGGTHGPIARALLTALQTIVFPVTGYRIEATLTPTATQYRIGATVAPGLRVLLVIKDARTGRTRETIVERDAEEDHALRAAGYRAAAWVLARSRWTPSWAAWGEDTAPALSRYVKAVDEDQSMARNDDVHWLNEALRTANRSGILLALAAQKYELGGHRDEALLCYLRALAMHPRYPVARYRAAIACAAYGERFCRNGSTSHHDALYQEFLVRLRETACRLRLGRVKGVVDRLRASSKCEKVPAGVQASLTEVSERLLRANVSLVRWRSIFHHAFRRSERRYWFSLANVYHPISQERVSRRTLALTNKTAIPAVAYRYMNAIKSRDGRWEERAGWRLFRATYSLERHPRRIWQASYNLACAWAVRAQRCDRPPARAKTDPTDRSQVLVLLEGAVNRPFFVQLTQKWVVEDTDLDAFNRPLRASMTPGKPFSSKAWMADKDELKRYERFLNGMRCVRERRHEWPTQIIAPARPVPVNGS
jgi:hypothetical protein